MMTAAERNRLNNLYFFFKNRAVIISPALPKKRKKIEGRDIVIGCRQDARRDARLRPAG